MVQQAWVWVMQHTKGRTLFLAVCLICMVALLCSLFLHGASVKHVYLVVDGKMQHIETRQATVGAMLAERRMPLGTLDQLSHSLDSEMDSFETITIERAFPVSIFYKGQEMVKFTSAVALQDALQQWDLQVSDQDQILPSIHTILQPYSTVHVTVVEQIIENEQEPIPFETITKLDATMNKGQSAVIQQGQEGLLLRKVEKILNNHIAVSAKVVDEWVEQASRDEIIAVGTKSPVTILSSSSPNVSAITKDGVTFGVKQIIEDVTLTAYDAGFNSTGKTEEHPLYGVTYSGAIVKAGQTVAVDPKVIPLNWWMYIEGIGFRKAEDIGSAIKGKIIDIYMENEKSALHFGRKRGYKVYVIGPEKPSGID